MKNSKNQALRKKGTAGFFTSGKNRSLIKIIAVSLMSASVLSGCSTEGLGEFLNLTPAVRTPPLGVDYVPTFSCNGIKEDKNDDIIPAQNVQTEPEPNEADALYETPDPSSFTEYPNMYVKKYVGEYEKTDRTVYLTFDDGPSVHTDEILKILKENDVKATFFVIPDDGEVCAKRLRAISAAGHTVGVHSLTHNYCTIYADPDSYVRDFAEAYRLILHATNQKPWLYRFPGGSVNPYNRDCRDGIKERLGERGFVYCDWNVDSNDWRGMSVEAICQNVVKDAQRVKNPIILMHDTDMRENTVAALDKIIRELKEKGYKFAPLTENIEPVQYGVNF